MPVDVQRAARPPVRVVVVGGQQGAPVGLGGRVQGGQLDAAEHAAQHREGERTAGQRLEVTIRQQPGHQRGIQAECGRIAVNPGEAGHRVEHRVQRLSDHAGGHALPPAGPAHPGRQHVRHGVLLGLKQQHLAWQPVEQVGGHLGRAHPERPPEVLVAAVVDDVVRAPARRLGVGQILRLVRGEELGHQHGPAVPGPGVPPRGRAAPAGPVPVTPRARAADPGAGLPGPGRGQRPDPGPDEGVIRRERLARRRALGCLCDGQRGLQQPPRLRRLHLAERHPGRLPVGSGAGRTAAGEQLVHLGGHPAVAEHPGGVVIHHHDQGVRVLARVAVHADDLVPVAEQVGVHVAVARGDRANVLGPWRPDHAPLDQGQRGRLGLHSLPRGAQAGDTGQQGQRGRAALLRRVTDQALADQFLDVAPGAARRALAPPGAQQLADHEFRVQRTAHRQQFAGGAQHLGKKRIGWRRAGDHRARPLPMTWVARPAWGLSSSALRAHTDSFPDSRGAVPRPRRMVAMFPRGADITGIQPGRRLTFRSFANLAGHRELAPGPERITPGTRPQTRPQGIELAGHGFPAGQVGRKRSAGR